MKLLLKELLNVEDGFKNKTIVDICQSNLPLTMECILKYEKKIDGILLDEDLMIALISSNIDLLISSNNGVAVLVQYGDVFIVDYAYDHYLNFNTLRKLVKLENEK